ncbi:MULTISPECIES: SMI1/KNR4 family protein [Corallococcus]|uniref:SMI1/KNR4 family protein n=1 Tax=Corallococcus TaxID=83461 RepID=UPI000ECB2943|nr:MULTISPECIES: SMI1/KNR4 family protein [Corallococcus]NPD24341.1 SMI1/KNR4 family protein [Corallococcus exiguus]NRD48181.1 SMI1/KNR4 family protein [Corallococcus exiguus]RKI00254.1 SMI1/KNR4 family protein [Corallococcus sp. AB038B]
MLGATQLPVLEVKGPQRFTAPEELLDAAEKALGVTLPGSYREFAKRYGFGEVGGMFTVHVPVPAGAQPGCAGLVGLSRELAGELVEDVDRQALDLRPDGTPGLVRRLVPFGTSSNGDVMAWDPAAASGPGELWIYLVSPRSGGVWRAAPNMAVFLAKAREPGLGGMMDRMRTRLPATFVPRPFTAG